MAFCTAPGEVFIAPAPTMEAGWRLPDMLAESLPDTSLVYNVAETIGQAESERSTRAKELLRGNAFVLRVPEGAESEYSQRASSIFGAEIEVAIPNFRLRPAGPVVVDWDGVYLQKLRAIDGCGEGVRIAVLDTGVDDSVVGTVGGRFGGHVEPQLDVAPPGYEPGPDVDGHGTAVTAILRMVAPQATILPVRVMGLGQPSTIAQFYAGVCAAELNAPPDIYNLSLRIEASDDRCPNCGFVHVSHELSQLRMLIELIQKRLNPTPVFVAAAGNYCESVCAPARYADVFAVGSSDGYDGQGVYEGYCDLGADVMLRRRFLLASGGSKPAGEQVGETDGRSLQSGTSFAAAVVSGMAASYLCVTCGLGNSAVSGGGLSRHEHVRRCFEAAAGPYPGARIAGLGVARYDRSVLPMAPDP